ncbi:hypothetical protein [Achromobacter piechaudii]|uniref:hypothetical protein n=1 Tax=Achromobacter piechaudii TaxID=72556 RepID=UPI003DA846EE
MDPSENPPPREGDNEDQAEGDGVLPAARSTGRPVRMAEARSNWRLPARLAHVWLSATRMFKPRMFKRRMFKRRMFKRRMFKRRTQGAPFGFVNRKVDGISESVAEPIDQGAQPRRPPWPIIPAISHQPRQPTMATGRKARLKRFRSIS